MKESLFYKKSFQFQVTGEEWWTLIFKVSPIFLKIKVKATRVVSSIWWGLNLSVPIAAVISSSVKVFNSSSWMLSQGLSAKPLSSEISLPTKYDSASFLLFLKTTSFVNVGLNKTSVYSKA